MQDEPEIPIGGIVKAAVAVVLSLLVIISIFGGFYTIDEGERAVITRTGQVSGVAEPGFNTKIPFLDQVNRFDTRSQAYTMSGEAGEGSGDVGERIARDDAIEALSSEGMRLDLDVTIRYRIDSDPETLKKTYSTLATDETEIVEKIVRPTARSEVRSCAGNYEGLEIYSTERASFQQCVLDGIEDEFSDNGLVLEEVQIRNVVLPQSVTNAINEKQAAEKRIEQKEAEVKIAEKEKERRVIEAEAEAEEIRITGEALRQNPEVLELRYIQALRDGNVIYVPSDGVTLTRDTAEDAEENDN